MADNISFKLTSPAQVTQDLGDRLARIRLSRNITQAALADQAGLSVRTLSRFEKGEGASLDTLIRLMQALGLEGHLEALLPDPGVQPVQRLDRGRERRRAGKRGDEGDEPWSWDEEEAP